MSFRLLRSFGGLATATAGVVAGRWVAPRADADSLQAGVLYKTNPDRRWFVFDFGNLPEVVAGQTISSPAVSASMSPLSVTSPVVVGPVVGTWVSSGTANEEYDVTMTVNLSGGGIVLRTGTMRGV